MEMEEVRRERKKNIFRELVIIPAPRGAARSFESTAFLMTSTDSALICIQIEQVVFE